MGFIEGIQDVGCGVYPVVDRRCGEFKTQFGEHLYLAVFRQVMIVLVVYQHCKKVGTNVSPTYDAVGAWRADYLWRGELLVAL